MVDLRNWNSLPQMFSPLSKMCNVLSTKLRQMTIMLPNGKRIDVTGLMRECMTGIPNLISFTEYSLRALINTHQDLLGGDDLADGVDLS